MEFALILPILLFLVVGIIDFGRAFNMQIALTQAAREGVRALALPPGDLAIATTRAGTAAAPYNDPGLSVIVLSTCPSSVTGTTPPASLTVGHPFQFTGTVFGFPAMTLTGKGEMRCNG